MQRPPGHSRKASPSVMALLKWSNLKWGGKTARFTVWCDVPSQPASPSREELFFPAGCVSECELPSDPCQANAEHWNISGDYACLLGEISQGQALNQMWDGIQRNNRTGTRLQCQSHFISSWKTQNRMNIRILYPSPIKLKLTSASCVLQAHHWEVSSLLCGMQLHPWIR